MSRPSRSFSPVDISALDRGVTLMQQGFEEPSASGDFLPEPGYARAHRLVRPEVAAHYLRQSERIADFVMAAHAFAQRILSRLRHRPAAGGRPSIPHAR
jgi:hypothetical protein